MDNILQSASDNAYIAAQKIYNAAHDAYAPYFGGSLLTDTETQQQNAADAAAVAYAAGVNNPNVPHSAELDAQYEEVARKAIEQLHRELAAVYAEADQPPPPSPASGNFWMLAAIAGLGVLIFLRR